MFCSNCGEKLDDGTRFCIKCGTKVEEDTPVQPASQQQAYPVTKKST
ncbi:MAG: zinc ribbon domain-containing protein [Spirochaetaceae bacterium]|nr:zinc ribbon domain-containing protein [Spirochaetaceae bacterium]